MVKDNPIYNFLHTYYRYSAEELMVYSPGPLVALEDVILDDIRAPSSPSSSASSYLLHGKFLTRLSEESNRHAFLPPIALEPTGRYGWISLTRIRDILSKTLTHTPNFACFGLHEWAMLYSGKKKGEMSQELPREKHQVLPFRVSQQVIDSVVEAKDELTCTHFDAFRFFHPDAQPMNKHVRRDQVDTSDTRFEPDLSRKTQLDFEQPACIHANMDLFKYAYTLYPLLPSSLLQDSLRLAIKARQIDMLASPYDLTGYLDSKDVLAVETPSGRKQYASKQLEIMKEATEIRKLVLHYYDIALNL